MKLTDRWTEEELQEFDEATTLASSGDQMSRISGRLRLRRLVNEHGKDKCDAMFEEIVRREEALRSEGERG